MTESEERELRQKVEELVSEVSGLVAAYKARDIITQQFIVYYFAKREDSEFLGFSKIGLENFRHFYPESNAFNKKIIEESEKFFGLIEKAIKDSKDSANGTIEDDLKTIG